MALKIVTIKEAQESKRLADKYGEFCFVQEGIAKRDYMCDNTGENIPKGGACACIVILRTADHPNKDGQIAMIGEYILTENTI